MQRILKVTCLLLVLLFLAGNTIPVHAQDYYFSVEKENVDVFVNEDGSLSIEYWIDFYNQPGAHEIDYVDIGLPNNNYVLNSITADINGTPINDIERSDYVDIGVAIGLGNNAIQPGQRGRLHVFVNTVNKHLYPSEVEADEPYASFEFVPNYFGSQYVTGSTDLTVTLYLPIGLEADEPRYHTPKGWSGSNEPETGFDTAGGIYYRWHDPNASVSSVYTFGASFPARLVPESQIVKAPAITFDTDALCSGVVCLGFVGFFIITIYSATVGARKRKLKYLPPKIAVEGHGIKRGLTAVEAAIVMEEPMDKIMTMILFGTLKKEAAEVLSREPLKIKAASPLPEGLYPYETKFLEAMQKPKKEQRKDLQEMMVELVNSVSKKMKGFSRKETVTYYKDIIQKAWNQVEAEQTPEVKSQKYEENLDWTMMDRNFEDRTKGTFSRGPVILPTWWWRYDPVMRPTMTGSAGKTAMPTSVGSGKTTVNLPNLPGADFAASLTNGVSAVAAGVVGDITNFTSGITNKTNPIPKTTGGRSSGGRSGGGGSSCACACACAGCACACAGGGR
jgi:hypothetical protein